MSREQCPQLNCGVYGFYSMIYKEEIFFSPTNGSWQDSEWHYNFIYDSSYYDYNVNTYYYQARYPDNLYGNQPPQMFVLTTPAPGNNGGTFESCAWSTYHTSC